MESQLQSSINNLSRMFNDRMAQFETNLQNSVPSNMASLSAEFTMFRSFVKEAMECLLRQVELLAHNVNQLEMQSRRKILLLHGVAEANSEDLTHMVTDLVKNKLNIDGFAAHEIKRCHRMGKPKAPNKYRPILIKFQHVSVRDEVWYAKTKLKGSGITVSEFLTRHHQAIFMTAREKLGVNKCWTRGGHVYVSGTDGTRQRVDTLDKLKDLTLNTDQASQNLEQNSKNPARTTKTRRNLSQKK